MSTAAHQERLLTVIRGPHVSEKSHRVSELNQVVLKVRTDATKKEIRQAVELLFEVEVSGVTVVNVNGKAFPDLIATSSPLAIGEPSAMPFGARI